MTRLRETNNVRAKTLWRDQEHFQKSSSGLTTEKNGILGQVLWRQEYFHSAESMLKLVQATVLVGSTSTVHLLDP